MTTWNTLISGDTTGIVRATSSFSVGATTFDVGGLVRGSGSGGLALGTLTSNGNIIFMSGGIVNGGAFSTKQAFFGYGTSPTTPDTTKGIVIDSIGLRTKAAGAKIKTDSLYLSKIAKHAFGNAAANLTDTNLVAGATATSVIVGGDYIPDGASVTYNALRKRVVVDTVFLYRVAITDPDSIGAMTLIK